MFSYEDIAFSVAPASTSSHSSGPSPHCVALAQNLIQTYSRCAKSMFLACMQYNNINMYICIYIYVYNYIYIYQNASKCHINKILIKKCHFLAIVNCQPRRLVASEIAVSKIISLCNLRRQSSHENSLCIMAFPEAQNVRETNSHSVHSA